MNAATLLKTATALPLVALLALAGCGGGGGGGTAGGPQKPGGTAGLMPATGLHIGEADANTGATTLSSTLHRNNSTGRSSIMDDAYVASLSSDGSGGFRVTYVIDGQESSVDFDSADFGAGGSPSEYYKRMPNGDEFWLWSNPANRSWTGDHYTQYGFDTWRPGGIRGYITDGTRTEAGDLPGGSATYIGEMFGDMFDNTVGSVSISRARTRTSGYLALTVNFADGSLGGRIFNLQVRGPGDSEYSNISATSRIDIENGRLNDKGQFTAELTGVEDDSNILPEDSVRGFEGDVLGEFYGPDAGEVAGVFNAKRAGNGLDQEIVGRFGGNRAVGADAIVTGVNRLVAEGRTVAVADDGMARIERTASGWTATMDGQTVEFSDSDYNVHPQLPFAYVNMPATDAAAFLESSTRGFRGNSEFDYFDVKRWAYANLVAGTDTSTIEVEDYVSSKFFYAVHGTRTPEGSMPATGTASYGGRMFAYSWASDDAVLVGDTDGYRAKVALTADFASAGISGEVSELMSRPASSNSFTPAMGGATFNAAITGNRLTANDLAGTGALSGFQNGSVEGAFFGPAAEEVGGVLDAVDTANNRLLMGYFGADKQ